MNICIVCGGYPTQDDPAYAFIRPVVVAMADMGITCTVISPQNILGQMKRKKNKRPVEWFDQTESGNTVRILQPYFPSFSKLKIKGNSISSLVWDSVVRNTLNRYDLRPDVMYGHFWDAAISAAKATNGKVPVIAVSGESKIRVTGLYDSKTIQKYLPAIKGVIAVSSKNLNESKQLGLLACSPKTVVLPNGYNSKEFFHMDKALARQELGIPQDDVIGCFVGAFSERKGVRPVLEAAKKNPDLKLFLIGRGDDFPNNNQILFSGSLPHNEICKYLNASDFFVLPTQAEGCCNAIVEAIACGLPIISSDLEFNWDILNDKNAILLDPNDIDGIAEAMRTLLNSPQKREEMHLAALRTALNLRIESRCSQIVDFINQIVSEQL